MAAVITLSLLGYYVTSFAYLGLLPFLSADVLYSIRLDGNCWWILRSLQRCSTGFKSWPWLDYLKTFTELSPSTPCAVLAVCSLKKEPLIQFEVLSALKYLRDDQEKWAFQINFICHSNGLNTSVNMIFQCFLFN